MAEFTPTAFKAYNWQGTPRYRTADVPINFPVSEIDRRELEQQFAYEWLESSGTASTLRNPPFLHGSAGHLHPALRTADTANPRILRGFIRRAELDTADATTRARLYFMYNPEQITREYVSYLDQGALDPFNTVFGSGNLVAPPSFMDFNFALFFDRQEEANLPDNPGVFVDYQFFDLVVRNVVPTADPASNSTLPDNGVMMVNPRDITVVFSPQITVQGRPLNARVNFEKFTHRMTPTRMTIQLTMRVIYFGPMREQLEYKAEELRAEAAIPFNEIKVQQFNLTYRNLEEYFNSINIDDLLKKNIEDQQDNSEEANRPINKEALDWAKKTAQDMNTAWSDTNRKQFPGLVDNSFANASSIVWAAYDHIGQADAMGWPEWATTVGMMNGFTGQSWRTATKIYEEDASTGDGRDRIKEALKTKMQYGDLLFVHNVSGHNNRVHWFMEWDGDNVKLFGAFDQQLGVRETKFNLDYMAEKYNFGIRPTPATSSSVVNSSGDRPQGLFNPVGADGPVPISATVQVPTGSGNQKARFIPEAARAFESWRNEWGGPLPSVGDYRSSTLQASLVAGDSNRFGSVATSYHCKGRAIDVSNTYLNSLSQADQDRLRNIAKKWGWGQARYKKGPAGCGAAASGRAKDNDEPHHFSWGGCG